MVRPAGLQGLANRAVLTVFQMASRSAFSTMAPTVAGIPRSRRGSDVCAVGTSAENPSLGLEFVVATTAWRPALSDMRW
jgi:hypothetical protein